MRCMIAGVLIASCLGGLVGCAPSDDRPARAPVNVKVTYDGKPVEGAVVTFMIAGTPPPAFGRTDTQGSTQLTTFESGDGAMLGTHTITITKQEFDGVVKDEGSVDGDDYNPSIGFTPPPKVKHTLPKKYALPGTSGLTAEVVSGDNEFTFDLVK